MGGVGGAFTMKRSAAEGDGRGESKAKQTTCRNIFLKGSEILVSYFCKTQYLKYGRITIFKFSSL